MTAAIGQDAAPLLAAARATLLEARGTRTPPGRDDKVLAGWNGLAIAALADAGVALARPDYLEAAREVAAFCLERMVVDGRLRRVWMDGRARHLGCLDDHADLGHGLLRLYEATFEPRWLEAARGLAEQIASFSPTPRAAASSTPAPTPSRSSPAPASSRTTPRRRGTPRPPGSCCAWPR